MVKYLVSLQTLCHIRGNSWREKRCQILSHYQLLTCPKFFDTLYFDLTVSSEWKIRRTDRQTSEHMTEVFTVLTLIQRSRNKHQFLSPLVTRLNISNTVTRYTWQVSLFTSSVITGQLMAGEGCYFSQDTTVVTDNM